MPTILLELTIEDLIGITTALAVARALYERDEIYIDKEIKHDIEAQLTEWRRIELLIAKQRAIDAQYKKFAAQKPL